MTSRRDRSRAALWFSARVREGTLRRLGVATSLVAITSALGCTQANAVLRGACCRRALLAALVPKLDLRWQLARVRSRDDEAGARVDTGFAAWLRWQPSSNAAQVPSRYELSPAAWASPCELDDVTCLAELAESERELAEALQEER